MPIPSSDESRPDTVSNSHGSRRISREIANLQQEIRDDFDQKLKELSGLMTKFRSLLANDHQLGSDLTDAANEASLIDNVPANPGQNQNVVQFLDKKISDVTNDIPVLTDRIEIDTAAGTSTNAASRTDKPDSKNKAENTSEDSSTDETPGSDTNSKPGVSRFATEPARFESGLYQLNSQLYRFKLELDQELEFREEPLHIHFQHQSELAKVLQQITEKMQQEKNTGHQDSAR